MSGASPETLAFFDGFTARYVESNRIAEYAREYVAATCAFEADQFGPGWQERLGRRHLAWAHLKGSCGFTDDEPAEVLALENVVKSGSELSVGASLRTTPDVTDHREG